MKLYKQTEKIVPDFSMEKFLEQYSTSSVVSLESVDLFLAKVKDSLQAGVAKVYSDEPRYIEEMLSNKRATIVKAREVKFQYFGQETVSKPESFSGYYTQYLKELLAVSNEVSHATDYLLDTLKMTVGTFINEYNDDKHDQIYGAVAYSNAAKKIDSHKKAIADYFKAPAGKVKTQVKDILKSLQDMEVLYGQMEPIAEIFTDAKIKALGTKISSVTDMVDALVQVNMTSGVLTKKKDSKEKLLTAIHTTAEYVEYYHALLAHWVFFCKAFTDLTKALEKFPSQS